jgi:hypothetical protein
MARSSDVTFDALVDSSKFVMLDFSETMEQSLQPINYAKFAASRHDQLQEFSKLVQNLKLTSNNLSQIQEEFKLNNIPLKNFWNALGSAGTENVLFYNFR